MIVPFAIDYDAVKLGTDGLIVSSALKGILKQWNMHGVLVCNDLEEVTKVIEAMPVTVKRSWQQALIKSRKGYGYWWRAAGETWSPLHTIGKAEEFKIHCAPEIDLACVSAQRADMLGVAIDRESVDIGGVEVVRFAFAPAAEVFGKVSELSQKVITKGTTAETVWMDRFAPLANECKRVVIVDRYVGDDYCQSTKASGIRKVLKYLSRVPTILAISIFTAVCEEMSPKRWRGLSSGLWESGSRCKVDMFFVPDNYFKREQHARYVRFDHLRCVIDGGIENLFGRPVLRKNCEFSLKLDSEYQVFENGARQLPGGQRTILKEAHRHK